MKRCIIFDFDSTITSSDTLKIILYELLKLNPLRFFRILIPTLQMLTSKDHGFIQFKKNQIIGLLIERVSHENINKAVNNYQNHISKILRHELISHIKEKIDTGYICLIVTASPAIFVSSFARALKKDSIHIIGTDFQINNIGLYNGKLSGLNCYGQNKPIKINQWIKGLSTSIEFEESWSDSYSDKPMMEMAKKKFWVVDKKNLKNFASIEDGYEAVYFNN